METITVRTVHEYEWREVRALRLRALQDQAASVAFVDDFENASSQPDEFWTQRVVRASAEAGPDAAARQFVAITEDGTWIGSVTVILERAGEQDYEGAVIETSGGAIVGVYLDPAFRGRGTIQRLLEAAVDWVRDRGLRRARLYVHVHNVRAQRAYEKAGFRPTGTELVGAVGREMEMVRDA